MNFRTVPIYLLLAPLFLFSQEEGLEEEEGYVLEEEADYAEFDLDDEKCDDDCRQYNPLRRYYPYRRIYQDSVIRESGDDDIPSWPGRRDHDFWDELTR